MLPYGFQLKSLAGTGYDLTGVASSCVFNTANPGGFGAMSFDIPRDIRYAYPEIALYAPLTLTHNGHILNESHVLEVQRNYAAGSPPSMTASVTTVGDLDFLKDDGTFRRIYCDADCGQWQSGDWAGQKSNNLFNCQGDSNGIAVTAQAGQVYPATANCVMAYDLFGGDPGTDVCSRFVGHMVRTGLSASWTMYVIGRSSPEVSAGQTIAATYTSASAGLDFDFSQANLGNHACVVVALQNTSGGAITPGADLGFVVTFTHATEKPGVYGSSIVNSAGIVLSDATTGAGIVKDVVTGYYTSFTAGDATGYVIDQAAYIDRTDRATLLEELNALCLWDYGWWDGHSFSFTAPPAAPVDARRYMLSFANVANMADWSIGPDYTQLCNCVVVSYQNAKGEPKSVTVTGTSKTLGANYRTQPLDMSGVYMSTSQATMAGTAYLSRRLEPPMVGTTTLMGDLTTANNLTCPALYVRAGDWIENIDLPAEVRLPMRVTATSADAFARTISVEIGGGGYDISMQTARLNLKALDRHRRPRGRASGWTH